MESVPKTSASFAADGDDLAELRNQRSMGDDFSYVKVLAIVLQLVAVVCLLAAVFLGRSEAETFMQWISTAVLFQLGTIAMLLFAGRR